MKMNKHIRHIYSICFRVCNVNDELIDDLQKTIDAKHLLVVESCGSGSKNLAFFGSGSISKFNFRPGLQVTNVNI